MCTGATGVPSGTGTVTSVKLTVVSARSVQSTGSRWLPGTTWRQPFSSSQGSSAIGFLRMLGGAAGVSLCGIVLEWRLGAHGASLTSGASNAARIDAFGETFLMLTALCVLALVAAWQLREAPAAPTGTPPSP